MRSPALFFTSIVRAFVRTHPSFLPRLVELHDVEQADLVASGSSTAFLLRKAYQHSHRGLAKRLLRTARRRALDSDDQVLLAHYFGLQKSGRSERAASLRQTLQARGVDVPLVTAHLRPDLGSRARTQGKQRRNDGAPSPLPILTDAQASRSRGEYITAYALRLAEGDDVAAASKVTGEWLDARRRELQASDGHRARMLVQSYSYHAICMLNAQLAAPSLARANPREALAMVDKFVKERSLQGREPLRPNYHTLRRLLRTCEKRVRGFELGCELVADLAARWHLWHASDERARPVPASLACMLVNLAIGSLKQLRRIGRSEERTARLARDFRAWLDNLVLLDQAYEARQRLMWRLRVAQSIGLLDQGEINLRVERVATPLSL